MGVPLMVWPWSGQGQERSLQKSVPRWADLDSGCPPRPLEVAELVCEGQMSAKWTCGLAETTEPDFPSASVGSSKAVAGVELCIF